MDHHPVPAILIYPNHTHVILISPAVIGNSVKNFQTGSVQQFVSFFFLELLKMALRSSAVVLSSSVSQLILYGLSCQILSLFSKVFCLFLIFLHVGNATCVLLLFILLIKSVSKM